MIFLVTTIISCYKNLSPNINYQYYPYTLLAIPESIYIKWIHSGPYFFTFSFLSYVFIISLYNLVNNYDTNDYNFYSSFYVIITPITCQILLFLFLYLFFDIHFNLFVGGFFLIMRLRHRRSTFIMPKIDHIYQNGAISMVLLSSIWIFFISFFFQFTPLHHSTVYKHILITHYYQLI